MELSLLLLYFRSSFQDFTRPQLDMCFPQGTPRRSVLRCPYPALPAIWTRSSISRWIADLVQIGLLTERRSSTPTAFGSPCTCHRMCPAHVKWQLHLSNSSNYVGYFCSPTDDFIILILHIALSVVRCMTLNLLMRHTAATFRSTSLPKDLYVYLP